MGWLAMTLTLNFTEGLSLGIEVSVAASKFLVVDVVDVVEAVEAVGAVSDLLYVTNLFNKLCEVSELGLWYMVMDTGLIDEAVCLVDGESLNELTICLNIE